MAETQTQAPAPTTRDRVRHEARRVRHGMRRPANWMQLLQFSAVGAAGYSANLAVFTLLVHAAGVNYLVSAVLAFLVAVTNNFVLNRHWTFEARAGHAGFQAARFVTVSAVALGVNLTVLNLLVAGAGLPEVPSQAIAIGCATPLNFIGNKLWSFRRPHMRGPG